MKLIRSVVVINLVTCALYLIYIAVVALSVPEPNPPIPPPLGVPELRPLAVAVYRINVAGEMILEPLTVLPGCLRAPLLVMVLSEAIIGCITLLKLVL